MKDLSAGEYELSAERVTARKLRLEIKMEDKKNNPILDIRFPAGKELKRGQDFLLSPEESGQNYWIAGTYDEDRQQGPDRWARERCFVEVNEPYCWVDRWGNRFCNIRRVVYPGIRDIRYYDVVTTGELDISFLKEETDKESVADLSANKKTAERVIQDPGYCRVY